MTRYISQPENLKLMMNMLKEDSKNIQFEAFHVFKVFVANPDKPRPIQEILLRNKDRLVEFLTRFHTERSEDEQFNDEKAYLIKQIKDLKPLTDQTAASGASEGSIPTAQSSVDTST
jgi:calcium binding protein 39